MSSHQSISRKSSINSDDNTSHVFDSSSTVSDLSSSTSPMPPPQSIGNTLMNSNSPLILPIAILLYAACQPTYAGIPYMVFLIIFVFLRATMFKSIKASDVCIYNLPAFGKTLNINIFVSVFSLAYILMPMIILKEYTIVPIVILVCYTLTNFGLLKDCYNSSMLIGDVFFGLVSAVASILIIIAASSAMNAQNKSFLFITSGNSSGEKCSMAAKQNFICKVYKNGQLVSQSPNIPYKSS